MQTIWGIWMRNLSLRRVSETEGVWDDGATEIFTEHLPSLLVIHFWRNLFECSLLRKRFMSIKHRSTGGERRSLPNRPGLSRVHQSFGTAEAHLVSKWIINDSITSQTRHDWLRLIMRASTKRNLMARHKRYIKFTFLPHYVRWRLGNREHKKAMKPKTFSFGTKSCVSCHYKEKAEKIWKYPNLNICWAESFHSPGKNFYTSNFSVPFRNNPRSAKSRKMNSQLFIFLFPERLIWHSQRMSSRVSKKKGKSCRNLHNVGCSRAERVCRQNKDGNRKPPCTSRIGLLSLHSQAIFQRTNDFALAEQISFFGVVVFISATLTIADYSMSKPIVPRTCCAAARSVTINRDRMFMTSTFHRQSYRRSFWRLLTYNHIWFL